MIESFDWPTELDTVCEVQANVLRLPLTAVPRHAVGRAAEDGRTAGVLPSSLRQAGRDNQADQGLGSSRGNRDTCLNLFSLAP